MKVVMGSCWCGALIALFAPARATSNYWPCREIWNQLINKR